MEKRFVRQEPISSTQSGPPGNVHNLATTCPSHLVDSRFYRSVNCGIVRPVRQLTANTFNSLYTTPIQRHRNTERSRYLHTVTHIPLTSSDPTLRDPRPPRQDNVEPFQEMDLELPWFYYSLQGDQSSSASSFNHFSPFQEYRGMRSDSFRHYPDYHNTHRSRQLTASRYAPCSHAAYTSCAPQSDVEACRIGQSCCQSHITNGRTSAPGDNFNRPHNFSGVRGRAPHQLAGQDCCLRQASYCSSYNNESTCTSDVPCVCLRNCQMSNAWCCPCKLNDPSVSSRGFMSSGQIVGHKPHTVTHRTQRMEEYLQGFKRNMKPYVQARRFIEGKWDHTECFLNRNESQGQLNMSHDNQRVQGNIKFVNGGTKRIKRRYRRTLNARRRLAFERVQPDIPLTHDLSQQSDNSTLKCLSQDKGRTQLSATSQLLINNSETLSTEHNFCEFSVHHPGKAIQVCKPTSEAGLTRSNRSNLILGPTTINLNSNVDGNDRKATVNNETAVFRTPLELICPNGMNPDQNTDSLTIAASSSTSFLTANHEEKMESGVNYRTASLARISKAQHLSDAGHQNGSCKITKHQTTTELTSSASVRFINKQAEPKVVSSFQTSVNACGKPLSASQSDSFAPQAGVPVNMVPRSLIETGSTTAGEKVNFVPSSGTTKSLTLVGRFHYVGSISLTSKTVSLMEPRLPQNFSPIRLQRVSSCTHQLLRIIEAKRNAVRLNTSCTNMCVSSEMGQKSVPVTCKVQTSVQPTENSDRLSRDVLPVPEADSSSKGGLKSQASINAKTLEKLSQNKVLKTVMGTCTVAGQLPPCSRLIQNQHRQVSSQGYRSVWDLFSDFKTCKLHLSDSERAEIVPEVTANASLKRPFDCLDNSAVLGPSKKTACIAPTTVLDVKKNSFQTPHLATSDEVVCSSENSVKSLENIEVNALTKSNLHVSDEKNRRDNDLTTGNKTNQILSFSESLTTERNVSLIPPVKDLMSSSSRHDCRKEQDTIPLEDPAVENTAKQTDLSSKCPTGDVVCCSLELGDPVTVSKILNPSDAEKAFCVQDTFVRPSADHPNPCPNQSIQTEKRNCSGQNIAAVSESHHETDEEKNGLTAEVTNLKEVFDKKPREGSLGGSIVGLENKRNGDLNLPTSFTNKVPIVSEQQSSSFPLCEDTAAQTSENILNTSGADVNAFDISVGPPDLLPQWDVTDGVCDNNSTKHVTQPIHKDVHSTPDPPMLSPKLSVPGSASGKTSYDADLYSEDALNLLAGVCDIERAKIEQRKVVMGKSSLPDDKFSMTCTSSGQDDTCTTTCDMAEQSDEKEDNRHKICLSHTERTSCHDSCEQDTYVSPQTKCGHQSKTNELPAQSRKRRKRYKHTTMRTRSAARNTDHYFLSEETGYFVQLEQKRQELKRKLTDEISSLTDKSRKAVQTPEPDRKNCTQHIRRKGSRPRKNSSQISLHCQACVKLTRIDGDQSKSFIVEQRHSCHVSKIATCTHGQKKKHKVVISDEEVEDIEPAHVTPQTTKSKKRRNIQHVTKSFQCSRGDEDSLHLSILESPEYKQCRPLRIPLKRINFVTENTDRSKQTHGYRKGKRKWSSNDVSASKLVHHSSRSKDVVKNRKHITEKAEQGIPPKETEYTITISSDEESRSQEILPDATSCACNKVTVSTDQTKETDFSYQTSEHYCNTRNPDGQFRAGQATVKQSVFKTPPPVKDIKVGHHTQPNTKRRRIGRCIQSQSFVKGGSAVFPLRVVSKPIPSCKFCDKFSAQWVGEVNVHVREAHPYRCYKCFRTFQSKASRHAHWKVHKTERHHCRLCKRVFMTRADYNRHVRGRAHQQHLRVQMDTFNLIRLALRRQTAALEDAERRTDLLALDSRPFCEPPGLIKEEKEAGQDSTAQPVTHIYHEDENFAKKMAEFEENELSKMMKVAVSQVCFSSSVSQTEKTVVSQKQGEIRESDAPLLPLPAPDIRTDACHSASEAAPDSHTATSAFHLSADDDEFLTSLLEVNGSSNQSSTDAPAGSACSDLGWMTESLDVIHQDFCELDGSTAWNTSTQHRAPSVSCSQLQQDVAQGVNPTACSNHDFDFTSILRDFPEDVGGLYTNTVPAATVVDYDSLKEADLSFGENILRLL